jgi:hypothetical protein
MVVFAGYRKPLLQGGPSRRYSADLSLCAWIPTPAASRMHTLVSSSRALAFPESLAGRRCAKLPTAISVGPIISGLQPFTDVQAHKFARLTDSTYPRFTLGSRGFYVRAYHRPVARSVQRIY